MSNAPVNLTPTGPPETVLDREPAGALDGLVAALARPPVERRDAVSAVVARWPRFLDGWARLGELARDDVEAYAAFRVGYHRGLDRLRANGWRGSGTSPETCPLASTFRTSFAAESATYQVGPAFTTATGREATRPV